MRSVKLNLVLILSFLMSYFLVGQESEHPRIYISNENKSDFLKTIETVTWKKELVEKKIKNLEKYLAYWEEDSTWLVSRLQMNWNTKHDEVYLKGGDFSYSKGTAPVPTVRFSGTRDWATEYKRPKIEEVIPYLDDERGLYLEHKKTGKKEWIHPSKSGHAIEEVNEKIMQLIEDAAFLYWVTGDEKYAEFATPVFFTYIEGMFYRKAPVDLLNSKQKDLSGLVTFEVIHEQVMVSLVIAYDFLFDYLKSNKRNIKNAEAVFQKWGDQIIKNGVPNNNWNLFQARFLTYIALVLDKNKKYENGKGREYFLDYTFNTSTDKQIAVKESLLIYDQENAMWPECPSYSVHVITTLLRIFTLLDNVTNINEISKRPILENATLASFQYLFPSGYMLGFGDSGHKQLPPENFELLLANSRKYREEDKELLMTSFLEKAISEGKYKRKAKDLFNLFFYVDALKDNTQKLNIHQLTTPTFYAPNVSMFNQRMSKESDAIMLSTVGSYGNHAHANGISLELFANNYALGPDMGKGPSYWHPKFKDFYARFPAHNTVIVDGKSDYNNMRIYHPFRLDNSFPKSGETSIFDKVTFSKVSFVEPKTMSNQQRFSAIIKSNTEKAYVIDVFRSKKQKEGQQKHEYLYHNLGQTLEISGLDFKETDDLSSVKGDLKGYDYFTNKYKAVSSKDVEAVFTLKEDSKPNNIMKLWVKGSPNQTIYKVKTLPSNALSKETAPKEVLKDSLHQLIIKRNEEAWTNPFALVFNPYFQGNKNPIKEVSYSSLENYPNTQIIDVLSGDEKTNDRIVLNASEYDVAKTETLYQNGLLSIIRTSKTLDFLFLSGVTRLDYKGWTILASKEPVTISIEKTKDGYVVQNDNPVTINLPYNKNDKRAQLIQYENGKEVSNKESVLNRVNQNQQLFMLHNKHDKLVIKL